ncbi:MAG: hypothetical protein ACKO40_13950 [Planctomycetaceae bacterium]
MDALNVGRGPRRLVAARLVLIGLAAAGRAAAEDDRVVEEPTAAQAQADQQHLIDLGANFDANLFEQQGNGWVLRGGNGMQVQGRVRMIVNGRVVLGGGNAVGADDRPAESPTHARARAVAEQRLERIDAACELTDRQRLQLRLAVESDIRRFAASIDAMRAKYAGVQVNLNDQEGQKKWHQFQQDVGQCRRLLHGLFEGESLFARSLPTTLDAVQLADIETETRERRAFRWRAMVSATLVRLDDMLGLTQAQHDVVERALLARQPALRVDPLAPEQDNTHLQQNLVYLVLSGSDPEPLRAAVSERQWRSLALLMNQGKSMRSWIEQQGILDGPPPDASAPPRRGGGRVPKPPVAPE